MALDRFKTQVLLLHSEQSTLDSLSSGFGDRYTVHCATSGSEALTTLGETPINVIISAQDLPGMSGVEALREAKKRSPDTIGILLAGNTTTDLEALVGAEEVFQIVRGSVTGDALKKLVDQATQQMRLMALAESANDTAANVDEPAQHIVMETSENGSTIISDGTGRMPALNPEKISPAVAVGSHTVDVLVITKDQEFLTTVKESSRGMHKVHYANTVKQADEIIREHKVGVAVIDAAMVGQKVEQLTLHLRQGSPRLVSIVAGRRDDGEMLMDLINRGKVYRFLLKPVSPGRARLAVEASVKHHLEAPDAAFKIKGGPASAAPPKPQARPKPAARQEPRKAAPPPSTQEAAPRPAAPKASAQQKNPADPPLGSTGESSPIDEGLSAAFAGDDSSFAETVTGLISTVGEKFKGKKDASPARSSTAVDDLATPDSGGDETGGAARGKSLIIGIAAVAVAAAGAAFWFMSGTDSASPQETAVPASAAETVDTPAATATPGVDVDALIAEAREARDAGRIFMPASDNAIELFAAAVEADPANAVVASELEAVIADALALAEAALLQSRSAEASAALQRVAQVDPDNERLPFLTAQLAQVQLRTYLAGARIAIRDTRFEDATNLLASARTLDIEDRSEIDVVAAELSAARSDQRADEVLSLASARLEEGALLRPPNDNARYYYELVLANDPANPAARQGLNVIASRLVLQARGQIDAGNLDNAEDLLANARAIDATSSELDVTQAALVAARDAIAARERRAAEERRQAEADRLAAEQRAEEERRAAAQRAEEERLAAEAAAAQPVAEEPVATSAQPESGGSSTTQAADDAPTEAIAEPVAAEEPAVEPAVERTAQPVNVSAQEPVSISSLTRTRYVAPKYPRTAERRGESGWVDVLFTVTLDGTVRDVEVRDSLPEGTFDKAAIRAVEKWTFEPVVENGVVVEKRAGVRMMFAIEN